MCMHIRVCVCRYVHVCMWVRIKFGNHIVFIISERSSLLFASVVKEKTKGGEEEGREGGRRRKEEGRGEEWEGGS